MPIPALGGFNDDLRAFGTAALAAGVWEQLAPEDAERCGAQTR